MFQRMALTLFLISTLAFSTPLMAQQANEEGTTQTEAQVETQSTESTPTTEIDVESTGVPDDGDGDSTRERALVTWTSGIDFARAVVEPTMHELRELMRGVNGQFGELLTKVEAQTAAIEVADNTEQLTAIQQQLQQQTAALNRMADAVQDQTAAIQQQTAALNKIATAVENVKPTLDDPWPVGVYIGTVPVQQPQE